MRKTTLLIAFAALSAISTANTLVIPHILEKSGSILDVCYDVIGAREAGSGIATGRRQYQPLLIRKRIDKSSPLLMRAITELTGPIKKPGSSPFQIHRCDNGPDSIGMMTFSLSSIIGLVCPSMDNSGRDMAGFDVMCAVDDVTFDGFVRPTKDEKDAIKSEQKKWLPANFRLKIDGIDDARVSKIDSFTIKQSVADLDQDGVLDLTCSDITCTVPEGAGQQYVKMARDSATGQATGRRCVCTYSDGVSTIEVSCVLECVEAGYTDIFSNSGDFTVRFRCVDGTCRISMNSDKSPA